MNQEDSRVVHGEHSLVKRERAREFRRDPTPTERKLWLHLRGSRFQELHFRQQQVIDGFIVDFYCHAASLVVEVDGGVHLNQQEYDQERDAVIAARGLRILRVPASDVESRIYEVLAQIGKAARSNTITQDPKIMTGRNEPNS